MAQTREFPLRSHQGPISRSKKHWKILIILGAVASAALYVPPARGQLQQTLVFSSGGAVAVRNDQTGALSPVSGSPFSSPTSSPFTLDVQSRFLFAPGNNSIHMFQITDSTTGAYQEVKPGSPFASTFTNDPVFIAVEPTGNYIAVVNRNGQIAGESSVETFQIQTNPPALVPVPNSFLELNSTPIGFSQPLDTKNLYLYLGPSFPSDPTMPLGEELDAVSIDPQSGIPSLQSLGNTPDNSTARCFAADPQGRFVVTGRGELVGQILVTGINGSFPSGAFDLGSNVFPSQLFVDGTGSFIYATYPPAPSPASAVHIFSLDASTGMIAETSSSPLPGFTAVPQFSADPTGPFNYGGDPQPNLAHAFTIDPVTGYFLEAPGSPYTVTGISFPLTFSVPPGQQGISGPSVSLSQTSLSFGAIQTNSSSSPQMVSVQSNGGQALSISSITLSGIDPSQFAATDTCHAPTVIQPGNFCSISLTFAPTVPGLQQATVMIADNAPGSPQSIQLTGTAINPPPPAPAVTITPNPVSFPTITQGTTSNPIVVTVKNTGNATLNISSASAGGNNVSDFTTTFSGCTGAIAPQGTCTVTVIFAPLAAGQRTETVTITDDASDSPQVINIAGNANPAVTLGAAPAGSTTATVAAGQPAQYNLQITPGAGYTGTVSLSCSGAPQGAACQLPSSIQITNGAAAAFTVMVTTSGGTNGVLPLDVAPRSTPFLRLRTAPGLTAAILLLLLFAFCVRQNSRERLRQLVLPVLLLSARRQLQRPAFAGTFAIGLFLVMLSLGLGAAGCGGGSYSTPPPQPPTIVTPHGTSTITINPAAMSASGKPLQLQPIQLTLTVN